MLFSELLAVSCPLSGLRRLACPEPRRDAAFLFIHSRCGNSGLWTGGKAGATSRARRLVAPCFGTI